MKLTSIWNDLFYAIYNAKSGSVRMVVVFVDPHERSLPGAEAERCNIAMVACIKTQLNFVFFQRDFIHELTLARSLV